jgi:hypothetical protein
LFGGYLTIAFNGRLSAAGDAHVRLLAMKKASGYFLLALSCLTWGTIAALPLFEISVGEAAAFTTGLIITGEVSFYFGIALLGKEAWEKIKALFRNK